MPNLRPYILPIAILIGLLFHRICGALSFLAPFLIFSILLLTFTAVDLRRLRVKPLHVWLLAFQLVVSIGLYTAITLLGGNHIIAEGVLIGILCPVASSVAVVACILGADRETVTTYTILDNIVVAVVAPVAFTLIGDHPELPLGENMLLILSKIGSTLALPFFLAALLQFLMPRAGAFLARYNHIGFYLWAMALTLTLGQTIDFIFLHGQGNLSAIVWLAVLALLFCIIQFALGRRLGHRYGDTVAGGQLLGQKNSAMGIWMANTFLNPLASVFMAFYSVYQNLFNAWQMAHQKKTQK